MVRVVIGKVIGDDGKSLEYVFDNAGYRVGIRKEGTTDEYTYSPSLKGEKGDKGDKGDNGTNVDAYIEGTTLYVAVGQDILDHNYSSVDLKGEQGIQGIQGLTGSQGDPATGVTIGSYYWFYVDENGDLYLEGEDVPSDEFYYDSSTGNLYKNYNTTSQISIGNVKGPKGDTQDLTGYYTKTEVDTKLSNIDLSNYYTKTEVDTKITALQTDITDAITIITG